MADELSIEEFEQLPAAARVSLRRFGQRTRLQMTDATLAVYQHFMNSPTHPADRHGSGGETIPMLKN